MGAIQSSVNQVLGVAAASTAAINHQLDRPMGFAKSTAETMERIGDNSIAEAETNNQAEAKELETKSTENKSAIEKVESSTADPNGGFIDQAARTNLYQQQYDIQKMQEANKTAAQEIDARKTQLQSWHDRLSVLGTRANVNNTILDKAKYIKTAHSIPYDAVLGVK